MHQKIFWKKRRKQGKKTSGIAYPPLLLLLSVSIFAELHLTADAPWRLLSRLRRTYLFICKSHYKSAWIVLRDFDSALVQLLNKPPLLFFLPQKNKSLPVWNRLPLSNKHKQRKHIEIVKKNCRDLVCAAAEYCPLEGYFGRKEDWWTGCLRQH